MSTFVYTHTHTHTHAHTLRGSMEWAVNISKVRDPGGWERADWCGNVDRRSRKSWRRSHIPSNSRRENVWSATIVLLLPLLYFHLFLCSFVCPCFPQREREKRDSEREKLIFHRRQHSIIRCHMGYMGYRNIHQESIHTHTHTHTYAHTQGFFCWDAIWEMHSFVVIPAFGIGRTPGC